jgi:hypothetical protein
MRRKGKTMIDHLPIETVPIEFISAGDCIFAWGDWRTVCKKDISSGFMGVLIFGLSFRDDDKKVKRVVCRK